MADFNGNPDPNGWMEQASRIVWRTGVPVATPGARVIAPDGRWLTPGIEQIATEPVIASQQETRYPDEAQQFIYSPLSPQWAGISDAQIEYAPGMVGAGLTNLAQLEAANLRLAKAPKLPGC